MVNCKNKQYPRDFKGNRGENVCELNFRLRIERIHANRVSLFCNI